MSTNASCGGKCTVTNILHQLSTISARLESFQTKIDDIKSDQAELKHQFEQLSIGSFGHDNLIQPYDGNILHWPAFWASYKDVVIGDSSLSDGTKFRLLYKNLNPR